MTIIPGAGRFRRRIDPRIIDRMNRARQNRGTATWGDWGGWNQRHAQRDQYNRRRGGGAQTTGVWAGDRHRGGRYGGEWDHIIKGDGLSRPHRRRRGGSRRRSGMEGHDSWGRGRGQVIDGGWDRGGRVWDDPAPSRRKRKRKDRKKKRKRRSSSKTIPVSRRRVEQVFNRYAPRAPRDNSRYRRDFYGQNRSDVDYSRFRRDFFGHNLRRKPRRFDFRRRIGPSNYQR